MVDISTFSERKFIGNMLQIFREPTFSSTKEWIERNVYLTSQQTADPGPLDTSKTPWMLNFLEKLDDPNVKMIVGIKSSRIAWTTYINGYIGKKVEEDKVNVGLCFAKADSRTVYFKDFLKPMLKSTASLYNVVTKYCHFNKLNPKHIQFDNCNLRLLNLGTSSDTKSAFFTTIIYEEPDEVKPDVGGQGNAISLVQDRKKTSDQYKILIGGTPTDANFSQVGILFAETNQMHFWVPCHHCGESHAITKKEAWDNFHYDYWEDERVDETYGIYNPATVKYLCPHCNLPWTFEEKNKNIIKALEFNELGWRAEVPEITSSVGFQWNELVSNFPGCNFHEIAKEILKAKKEYDEGKEQGMKKVVNTKMGLPYSPLHKGVNVEELIKKRLSYSEGTVHQDGLILLCGIDKQRGSSSTKGKYTSRFECVVRAFGKNGNSYLVKYEVIDGNTQDISDPVWDRLSDFVNTEFPHASGNGRTLPISAVAIDCGDDTELVYRWVDRMTSTVDEEGNEKRPEFCSPLFGNAVFAVAGSSQKYDMHDIYNDPATLISVNPNQERKTVAESMGITRFMMGTFRTHEELQRRINLEGTRDRWYHCATQRPFYEKGLLSCTKTVEGQWKQIPGWAKEVRDCERMNLWLSYVPLISGDNFICISQMSNSNWAALEYQLFIQGVRR